MFSCGSGCDVGQDEFRHTDDHVETHHEAGRVFRVLVSSSQCCDDGTSSTCDIVCQGIAAGCPLVAWGLSRSHVLSSVLALMAVIFAAFVFFGPLPLRLCCTLRTGWIALMASMYASAMCWARRERDPNAINAPLVFAVGALLGMDSKHAAFGLLSHPLFHVGLWSWGYILGKSSVVFEKQMQQLDCEEVYVFTSDDKGYTSMRPLEEQETDATSTEPEPEGSCEAEFG
eukprot:CAMPEP_0169405634 /NCGR_PEP_ID=MMETSP1017-20121227/57045_1 /TAXON_ID=342587 /ORGANISM="Karlodinium micrum, Strain CCMP2283" /LENGTH=228 /DNA_ID=CAMNT_0009512231 /DNA_START=165 /DNA_END=847 /DNA_ORIENTATION=+